MWLLVVINIISYDSVAIGNFDNIQTCTMHKERVESISFDQVNVLCTHIEDGQRA